MPNTKLIEILHFCASQCTRCYDACMFEKEKDMLHKCMMMVQDCADTCRLTAEVLERESENADIFLRVCIEICERCAAECDLHEHLDHCKASATASRDCAELCQHQVSVQ